MSCPVTSKPSFLRNFSTTSPDLRAWATSWTMMRTFSRPNLVRSSPNTAMISLTMMFTMSLEMRKAYLYLS